MQLPMVLYFWALEDMKSLGLGLGAEALMFVVLMVLPKMLAPILCEAVAAFYTARLVSAGPLYPLFNFDLVLSPFVHFPIFFSFPLS